MIQSYKIEQKLLKYTTLVKSVIVCFFILSLCGCSFDEPWDNIDDKVFDSDVTYLAISLTSDGEPLLISSGGDNDVANAHFYFYDSDGNYVTRGEIDFDTNISSNILVILTNIKGKNYPKYVVTVLNQPDDFEYTPNLAAMQDIETTGGSSPVYDNGSNLVMSTSTYYAEGRKYNFVTEMVDSDFVEGQVPEDLSKIEAKLTIPIERLAAKVTVKPGESLTSSSDNITISEEDGTTRTLYKLSDDRYVELLGWKINAVARKSYIFKNIDTSWDDTNLWVDWNSADEYRCDWAKSFNYGLTDSAYPESNIKEGNDKANTPTEEANSETWLNDYLEYVNLKDELISISDSTYCPENTNTVGDGGVIQVANSSAITSVLIKARACDADGNALELSGYTDGLMYYNIPIKHVNQPDPDDNTLIEGEYGVVRSYHYTISISSISSLGSPITDEDEVIIPSDTDYNLSFTITSLPWKLFDETVDYTKQLGGDYIDITGSNSGYADASTIPWSVTEIDFSISE
ncbi:MAG: fimbria major subunit [Prevotella sp.]|nr:fimbria major subunit [Prevotella sp.]